MVGEGGKKRQTGGRGRRKKRQTGGRGRREEETDWW